VRWVALWNGDLARADEIAHEEIAAEPGTPVRCRGADLWRAEDGLVREYWLSDDLLDLLQQVGTVPSR